MSTGATIRGRNGGRIVRCGASARPVSSAHEERSRPRAATDLSTPNDDDDRPATGSERVAHLSREMVEQRMLVNTF
jgi:hypothetical protein